MLFYWAKDGDLLRNRSIMKRVIITCMRINLFTRGCTHAPTTGELVGWRGQETSYRMQGSRGNLGGAVRRLGYMTICEVWDTVEDHGTN